VAEQCDINSSEIVLLHGISALEDDRTLGEYAIQDGKII
jgi:hypothetical protein